MSPNPTLQIEQAEETGLYPTGIVHVRGGVSCMVHGSGVDICYDYSVGRYFHRWKNGGRCSSPCILTHKKG